MKLVAIFKNLNHHLLTSLIHIDIDAINACITKQLFVMSLIKNELYTFFMNFIHTLNIYAIVNVFMELVR